MDAQIAYQQKNKNWILPARWFNTGTLWFWLDQVPTCMHTHAHTRWAPDPAPCGLEAQRASVVRALLHTACRAASCSFVAHPAVRPTPPCHAPCCAADVAGAGTSIRFHVAHTSCWVKKYRTAGNDYYTDELTYCVSSTSSNHSGTARRTCVSRRN